MIKTLYIIKLYTKKVYVYMNNVTFVDDGECPRGCCYDSWRGHGL